jgi:hypothetical protein
LCTVNLVNWLFAVAHPTGMLALQVEAAVRHALQEAARRSEGSFHRGSGNAVGAAGDSMHSNGSAGDSVRDGMSFRQACAVLSFVWCFVNSLACWDCVLTLHCCPLCCARFALHLLLPHMNCFALLVSHSRLHPCPCCLLPPPPPQFVRMLRAGSTDCLDLYDDRQGSSLGSPGSLGQLRYALQCSAAQRAGSSSRGLRSSGLPCLARRLARGLAPGCLIPGAVFACRPCHCTHLCKMKKK